VNIHYAKTCETCETRPTIPGNRAVGAQNGLARARQNLRNTDGPTSLPLHGGPSRLD
jgi:hypothetical protein